VMLAFGHGVCRRGQQLLNNNALSNALCAGFVLQKGVLSVCLHLCFVKTGVIVTTPSIYSCTELSLKERSSQKNPVSALGPVFLESFRLSHF